MDKGKKAPAKARGTAKDQEKDRNQGLVRRPEHAGRDYVAQPAGDWGAALTLGSAELDRTLLVVSAVNVRLPRGGTAGAERAAQRRLGYSGLGSLLVQYAAAVNPFPEVLYAPGSAGLVEIEKRINRAESVRAKAGRALTATMDLRLGLGGLQWYMLQKVLRAVVDRMESPACPPDERERLASRFSRLLLRRAALLMTREERRLAREKRREQIAAELAEIELRTLIADTEESVRQKRQIDPAVLERVALAWKGRQQKGADPRATQR